MKFRKIIFWSHLILAIPAAIFIFIMSATGVVVMYEHAIINAVSAGASVERSKGTQMMSVDALAAISREGSEGARLVMMAFDNREGAPLSVYHIGKGGKTLNPYTGGPADNPAEKVEDFFHEVIKIHRWLGQPRGKNQTARAVMGASNLVFLFLIISGLYLWLPKIWKWSFIKLNLFFRRGLPTSKARDYNWHYVFGAWALIPLFFIALSGVVISYPWAGKMVYKVVGEEPTRGGPGFLGGTPLQIPEPDGPRIDPANYVSLQSAFNRVKATDDNWTSINVVLPMKEDSRLVRFLLNNGNGYLPEQRVIHTFDLGKGEIVSSSGYEDMSRGRKLRMWMRFVHTGEQYGLLGSTLAGLASLAACFLVWTGLALSYRRLIQPLFRRRGKPKPTSAT